jgi:hypothetical protein
MSQPQANAAFLHDSNKRKRRRKKSSTSEDSNAINSKNSALSLHIATENNDFLNLPKRPKKLSKNQRMKQIRDKKEEYEDFCKFKT